MWGRTIPPETGEERILSNMITWSYTTACDALPVRERQVVSLFSFVSASRVRIAGRASTDPILNMLTVSPVLFSSQGDLELVFEIFRAGNHLYADAIRKGSQNIPL